MLKFFLTSSSQFIPKVVEIPPDIRAKTRRNDKLTPIDSIDSHVASLQLVIRQALLLFQLRLLKCANEFCTRACTNYDLYAQRWDMCAEDERRILIVSHSIDLQKILRLSLELSVKWMVIAVGSVDEGIALAAVASPDAILLDANLSEQEISTALKTLRNDPATQHSRVLIIASRVSLFQQPQFRQMEAMVVFFDSFNSGDLAQQIATALDWSDPENCNPQRESF